MANVLLTGHGPVVIDWSRASRGHPLGDVARYIQIHPGSSAEPGLWEPAQEAAASVWRSAERLRRAILLRVSRDMAPPAGVA